MTKEKGWSLEYVLFEIKNLFSLNRFMFTHMTFLFNKN